MYAVIASSPLVTVPDAEENQILIQTMTHIMYNELPSGQKEYKFKCDDLVALGEKNPALKTKHGKIFKQTEFPCSSDITRLLSCGAGKM